MTTKLRVPDANVQIGVDEAELAKQARAFRDALRPFGLDRFLLSDVPERVIKVTNGRILAEFQTMPLVVWYPQKLNEMAAAGLDVVVYKKKSTKHPPVLMYYVRSVREIWRKM